MHSARSLITAVRQLWRGIALVLAIGLLAWLGQAAEQQVLGHAVFEALVLAILLGVAWRSIRGVPAGAAPGVAFSAKQVLEFAIVLLGASVDGPNLVSAGPTLLAAILVAVTVGISVSTVLGRLMGLNPRLATLVAVGNSICGNSAIAAVAPVIGASADDIASSIALTAVLGVVLVLLLPLFIPLLGFTFHQYGILAGMTVYAVPQVLAATLPVSAVSGQIATLVKLTRVLLLGPVVMFFNLRQPAAARAATARSFSLTRFLPWFLIGFVVLAVARSTGLLPSGVAGALASASSWLTIGAMAALGLGVDIRSVARVGRPVLVTVFGSLAVLIVLSAELIRVLGV